MSAKRRAHHLTVRAVRPLIAGLDALGIPSAPALSAAGISRDRLSDPDGRLPAPMVTALWEHALTSSGDPDLGMHLAEAAPVSSFDIHAYAMLSSGSLREAYRRACRYQRLIHEVTDLSFDEGPEEGTLRHALPGGRPVARHPAEFLVTAWVRFGRLVTGEEWAPAGVYFAHDPPPSTTEHARLFRAPVHFRSGRTALRIRNEVLDRPGTAADAALAGILDRHVATILAASTRAETLADRARAALEEGLGSDRVGAQHVARALSVSERSLRRGLEREGTSLRRLLDEIRKERSVALLTEGRSSIGEVAFLLGFAELSSFYRAFRRWTGSTPAEVRSGKVGRIGQ